MTDLQIFTNEQFGNVRVVDVNGDPWFVAADVCKAFGVVNNRNVTERLTDDEKGVGNVDTLGGTQRMVIVNEAGLYHMLFTMEPNNARGIDDASVKTRVEALHQFKRWITHEVLPAIRKHGGYLTPEKIEEALLNPDTIIRLATELKAERAARMELEAKNAALLPKGDYYDNLVKRDHLTSLRETAKELSISERYFVESLIENEYLYRNKRGTLLPMNGKNRGYFEVKDYCNTVSGHTGVQTLVTVTGKQFLIRFFNGGAA